MRQVTAHGILLAVVLIAAWVTWTSDEPADTTEATIPVWDHDPGDVTAVSFESAERSLQVERRETDERSYLWARQTTRLAPPPQPTSDTTTSTADTTTSTEAADTGAAVTAVAAADDANAADDTDAVADSVAADSAAAQERERVDEYPVGDEGDSLIERFAQLRAVRDLGAADDELRDAYGLADSAATVTVRFRDGGERTLALGNTAIGGSDRYVLDVERDRIFAVPVTLIRPLETGSALRLTEYQTFEADDVARVTVGAGGAERTMERHAAGTSGPETWSPPNSDEQDPAFAGFMDQVDRLWVSEFVADASADTLDALLRVDYYDRRDNAIGYLELFRTPSGAESSDSVRYFMRSPRTLVLGQVYGPLGERLEQDIETMFGGDEPAATSAGAATPRPAYAGRGNGGL